MASTNSKRYHYNEYDKAMICYRHRDLVTAEELCAALVTDFYCPRVIQIQAWQLRSLCTNDYGRAKSLLDNALRILEIMDEREELVPGHRKHTEEMLAELEEAHKGEGETPPHETEQLSGPVDSESSNDADAHPVTSANGRDAT